MLKKQRFALNINSMKKRYLKKIMKSAAATPLSRVGSKIRRFFLCITQKEYVRDQEKRRSGECVSCGKCCMLPFRCPFLIGDEDNFRCGIYNERPGQCRAFPIDERDLKDVNYQCGYFFVTPEPQHIIFESPLLQIQIEAENPSYYAETRT